MTENHKNKIGEANKIALKGIKRSEEFKRKISNTMKGKMPKFIPNTKGMKRTEEHQRKLNEANKGKHGKEKNPRWKGGITPITKQIRESLKYKQWRQDIFIRDNFTCQICSKIGGKLEAHHIKLFSKIIEEIKFNLPLMDLFEAAMIYDPLWNINNGITYCEDCHKLKKIHKWGKED